MFLVGFCFVEGSAGGAACCHSSVSLVEDLLLGLPGVLIHGVHDWAAWFAGFWFGGLGYWYEWPGWYEFWCWFYW